MHKLLARYLADFNRHEWFDPQEEPGPWSTLAVVLVVLVLVVVYFWR